jgi:hypothetical protein
MKVHECHQHSNKLLETISKISEEESDALKSISQLKESLSLERASHSKKLPPLSDEQECCIEVEIELNDYSSYLSREKWKSNLQHGKQESRSLIRLQSLSWNLNW